MGCLGNFLAKCFSKAVKLPFLLTLRKHLKEQHLQTVFMQHWILGVTLLHPGTSLVSCHVKTAQGLLLPSWWQSQFQIKLNAAQSHKFSILPVFCLFKRQFLNKSNHYLSNLSQECFLKRGFLKNKPSSPHKLHDQAATPQISSLRDASFLLGRL